MKRESIRAVHTLNIVFQSIFNLLWQMAFMVILAYLTIKYLEWPEWVYAPFILLGVLSGIWSMLKFILSASRSLEAIEKEHAAAKKAEAKRKKTNNGVHENE